MSVPIQASNSRTHLERIVEEGGKEGREEFVGVVDLLGVLAEDPDQRRLGFRLIQLVEVGAERRDDALVPRRVLAEDVLSVASGYTVRLYRVARSL
jgi:hypothetical protein